jgi:serine/threonine protein kinase/Tol biopolymer transport system component
MPLATGTRLGPYEVLGPLGAGGMGEVYRARDTRLDRSVAIKVLPSHLAATPELRARFEREARAVSALNHPHICTLHDVGQQDGVDYLVMEHIEGETLAQRLTRGPLPTSDVLRFGIELADALDRAHRSGIVHRDLKPGNVMITKSGVKLTDFGLAWRGVPAGGSGISTAPVDLSQSPTLAQPLTAEGTLVGTFQYMAPEQLEGKEADARTDLFALGAVLYEMATGNKAFEGRSQASLISAIMSSEPAPISAIVPMSPPALDRVVRACLAKDPDERISTAHDVKLQLQWIRDAGSQAGVPAPLVARRKNRERTAWVITTLAVLAALLAVVPRWLWPAQPDRVTRFTITAPPGLTFSPDPIDSRISPDGRTLAAVAFDTSGVYRVWVRPLESLTGRFLEGTENSTQIFWSPDSRSIGFFADARLKKVDLAGGTPEAVCDAPDPRGATWSRSGTIVFAPTATGPLMAVPAEGGTPTLVASPDSSNHETALRWPEFLPYGRHFMCVVLPTREGEFDAVVYTLGDRGRKKILSTEAAPIPAGPGRIVFSHNGHIVAQSFDERALAPRGAPVPIGLTPPLSQGIGARVASASANGVLAHLDAGSANTELVWFDRGGHAIATIPTPPAHYMIDAVSPDARRAVVVRASSSTSSDLWMVDLVRGLATRFTFTPSSRVYGMAWSPDGSRVAYNANPSGPLDIFIKSADGAGDGLCCVSGAQFKNIDQWSPDGKFLVFEQPGAGTGWDIWLLPVDGDRKPIPYLHSRFNETAAGISPDGRWMLYASDESGRAEIYVQSYPTPGNKYQVSSNGALYAVWVSGGREMLMVGTDGTVYAATVRTQPTFSSEKPHVLFRPSPRITWMSPAPDGQRMLAVMKSESSAASGVVVEMNWPAGLAKK